MSEVKDAEVKAPKKRVRKAKPKAESKVVKQDAALETSEQQAPAPVSEKSKAAEPASTEKADAAAKEQQEKKPEPVVKTCSPSLTTFLTKINASIAFTSYQSGRLYLLGSGPNKKLSFHERIYQRAMGIVGNAKRLYMGGLYQIWRFENILAPTEKANKIFDKCYVPRNAQYTGAIDIHELGIKKDGTILFINTKYNCLCEPSVNHSFKVVWKPKFISKIVGEDRCHLNGLAMVDGEAKYVTAICKSDTIDGWRERRHDGGVIIDVTTDEIVCEGLSMPHSPRWANGKLWVLNSGTGYLGYVDFETKSFVPHTFCPGFLRGLSIKDNYAVVGLSKPRYERFEGLQLQQNLEEKDSEAWCGIQIIDLKDSKVVEWARLDGPVTELFDATFIEGVKCPMALGQNSPENLNLISFESKV
ncbi:TIGR03032 family protein [Thalassotalea sp. LPB0316]|uniref:TIGR03032 family protein n=1 Tax=Thalassotalea sp. LPB0316 TaxID=2769490 RepID=UPI0018665DD2|nr:TIGR03032 family protein [Thalassotalea sp. LPB0316]QOL26127.1 TIGR03032 family protein [Thalassotalea sp. LPB0316]